MPVLHTRPNVVARLRAFCTLPVVFALTAGPVLLALALLIPPGDVPDEFDHAARAESLLRGEIVGLRRDIRIVGGRLPGTEAEVIADPAIVEADMVFTDPARGE